MLGNLKALIVVLSISIVVFYLIKPICLLFMEQEVFLRRRNIWWLLTATAFLTPNFWVYVLIALPLLIWIGIRDSNPLSVYLFFLFVIPPWGFEIPTIGINALFDLNQSRLLSLAILIPAAWRLLKTKTHENQGRFSIADVLVLSFGLLQLLIYLPYESTTNSIRRMTLFLLDIYLPFFVAKQACQSRTQISDAMAAFFLACALFAPIAIFESVRTWVLYAQIGEQWGYVDLEPYLLRGNILRAQASTGHPLTLGYLMAIGFGFWLYLQSKVQSSWKSLLITAWMWAGLLAAYSRGPWLTAILLYFLFLLQHPAGTTRFFKSALAIGIIAGLILLSPAGDRIVDNLPFVGTVDQQNVVYRQQLAATSLTLIQKNPFFGDPFVLLQMENLRQGQGIIDLVNAYATVALFYGLVGLAIFVGIFASGVWSATLTLRRCKYSDPELSLLGSNLVACMFATMFFMATAGSTSLQYIFAGILASYSSFFATRNSHHLKAGFSL